MTRQESGKLKDRQPAVWQEALIAEPALQAVLPLSDRPHRLSMNDYAVLRGIGRANRVRKGSHHKKGAA